MPELAMKLIRLPKTEDGPTAVEYAIMLALIVIVCLTAIGNLARQGNNPDSPSPEWLKALAS
jgi:pilus assembly protein Flp/PilA